jgi:hypothetical protein
VTVAIAATIVTVPERQLYQYPLVEDGFYSLSVARHVGLGEGITIDGVHRTNGFQPLWVFLVAPLFAVLRGTGALVLRVVLSVSWIIWVATAAVLGVATARFRGADRRLTAGLLASLQYLSNLSIFEFHFNGLETGLALLLFALMAVVYTDVRLARARRVALLAMLSGLLVLTRIDTVFFVGFLALAVALEFDVADRRRQVVLAAAILVGAAIISSPWWLYNLVGFGSLLPSSGAAQVDWRWRPGRAMVLSIYSLLHAVPLPVEPFWSWPYALVALSALIVTAARAHSARAAGIGAAGARCVAAASRAVCPRRARPRG